MGKRPLFVDVAVEAGLRRAHRGGTPEKGYIIEAKGGGLAVLDAEGDGDLDLYWVNGATLDDSLGAGNALYRNDGEHGFRDVARPASRRPAFLERAAFLQDIRIGHRLPKGSCPHCPQARNSGGQG